MNRRRNLIVGIVLTAAAATAILTTVSAPNSEIPATEDASSAPVIEAPTQTVPVTESAPQGGCGYQWAYHDDPELTTFFDTKIKTLDPNASGRAQLFGEDCVYSDGTSTFSAMETDFYVRATVDDLNNKEEEFGNWVKQVLEIVTQIPREALAVHYGFVEFWFEKTQNEHLTFRVPIQKYIDEAQEKNGAELFQMFYPQP